MLQVRQAPEEEGPRAFKQSCQLESMRPRNFDTYKIKFCCFCFEPPAFFIHSSIAEKDRCKLWKYKYLIIVFFQNLGFKTTFEKKDVRIVTVTIPSCFFKLFCITVTWRDTALTQKGSQCIATTLSHSMAAHAVCSHDIGLSKSLRLVYWAPILRTSCLFSV